MTEETQTPIIEPDGKALLQSRVYEWLKSEGFPTEFATASAFQQNGFFVRQGDYVRTKRDGPMRELDVVASKDIHQENSPSVRVTHIVECKWSQDKPWVVFTSPTTHMAHSACIAQTIGSRLGIAALWSIAGDKDLAEMDIFHSPKRGGFGGRQALSKQADPFYAAVMSVIDNSHAYVAGVDANKNNDLAWAEVVFPVVVVDGILFTATFDERAGDMKLEEVDQVRCHWRGSSSAIAFSTVDIVSSRGLAKFVEVRASETNNLLRRIQDVAMTITKCARAKSLEELHIDRTPRGVLNFPTLLRDIEKSQSPAARHKARVLANKAFPKE